MTVRMGIMSRIRTDRCASIAHGIMDSGELGISADDLMKVEKVNFWLPLTRTMVRRMLKNDFGSEFLSYLHEA